MRAGGGRTVVWTALIAVGSMTVVAAQERPFRESMSIPVDAEVAKSLRMVRDQWDNGPDAATLSSLIELCDAHGDQLVQQDRGIAGGAARFVRLQALADELVAGLPPELLAVYRKRIDPLAEPWWKAWQATGDVRYLDRLVSRAFYSSWGDDAVNALAQWHWDRGDVIAARRLWQRLLPAKADEPPVPSSANAVLSPAAISARLILCDLASRNRNTAETALAEFHKRYPNEEGTLAGRTDRWAALLQAEWEGSQGWQPQPTSEDVITFGGDFSRQHVAPQSLDIGGELWSVSLPNPRLPSGPRNGLFPTPLPLAFHPAIVDDLVLLNDGRQIHAWNLYSGKPYWDAGRDDGDVIYPVVADPSPMMPVRPVTGQAEWTVTVAQGRVYARMGSAVTTPAATEFRDLPAELVCLDISQGEGLLLWKQTADDLAPAAGELPVWRWEGSPVVEDGRVYAVLSRRRPQLEWAIACLDAETGLMLWQRPLGITRPTPPNHENRVSNLLLTSGGGQLFLATGWGAVAAIDPQNGTVNWAMTYESHAATTGSAGDLPLLYADGRLYAALIDGDRLACLDALTGRFVWSQPLTESYREILGVAQGRLIVSGRSLWGFDAATGKLHWSVPASDPEDWGYGRGALAGQHVLWTTHDALWFLDRQSGELLREHPLRVAESPRSGGNVIVSHGVILIAGAERLTAYGEYGRLQEALQQPVSDARQNLRRELKLAEIAWITGTTTQAEELWDRVRQQDQPTAVEERRRASARVALLPGRRSPRMVVRHPAAVAVTPVVASTTSLESRESSQAGAAFWQRLAHRRLEPHMRALVPQVMNGERAAGILLHDSSLALWNVEHDVEQPLAGATQPVEWCGQTTDRLVVVTVDEILVMNLHTGMLVHRLPRPIPSTPSTKVEWVLHPQGLLMFAPRCELALLDLTTGAWRWKRTADFGGWQPEIGFSTHRLALHPQGIAGAEIWDVATGVTLRREHPATGPWKLAPVFSGREDDYVTVTEDQRLVGVSTVASRRWEYVGLIPQAHAPPWVFYDGEEVLAVLDGSRLVRIARDSVWPRWSTPIAEIPLRSPTTQAAIANRRLFTAAAGVLRAIDLETGRVLWKSTYRNPGLSAVRCVIVDRDAPHPMLTVVPDVTTGSTTEGASVDSVTLYSAATGRAVQSLKLPSPSSRLEATAVGRQRIAVLTDRDILVLAR